MSFEEVVQKHKTSFNANKPAESSGLTDLEAKARLAQHGPNILTPVKSKPAWLLFLECFGNLFNILLLLCCVFTFILVGIDPVANRNNVSFFEEWLMR
jgi:magnesium-transporting ATPase (P-type)